MDVPSPSNEARSAKKRNYMGVPPPYMDVPSPSNNEAQAQIDSVRSQLTSIRDKDVSAASPDLRHSIDKLNSTLQRLLKIVTQANVDLEADSKINLAGKMDVLISQNEDMGKALLRLLELHHEYLPRLAARAGRSPMPDLVSMKSKKPKPIK